MRARIASAASNPQDIYDCRTCGACCAPEINDALYVGVTASDIERMTPRWRSQHVAHDAGELAAQGEAQRGVAIPGDDAVQQVPVVGVYGREQAEDLDRLRGGRAALLRGAEEQRPERARRGHAAAEQRELEAPRERQLLRVLQALHLALLRGRGGARRRQRAVTVPVSIPPASIPAPWQRRAERGRGQPCAGRARPASTPSTTRSRAHHPSRTRRSRPVRPA